jgi:hypothetical protein
MVVMGEGNAIKLGPLLVKYLDPQQRCGSLSVIRLLHKIMVFVHMSVKTHIFGP